MVGPCSQPPRQARPPRVEVADVFRLYGPAYRRTQALPASHRRVMADIEACRTAALGGHLERCDACGFEQPAYNSCGNRHCPKCQAVAKARWLEARRADLLPVDYFHSVFTLPHLLNPLVLTNKRLLFDLLFHATAETLSEFARDPRHGLAGQLGFTAILHTWDQKLLDHIHLHCLIPGGALRPDGPAWTPARPGFLFPVRQLSELFRGKFMAGLTKAFTDGHLQFPGKTARFQNPNAFQELSRQLWTTPRVVYTKPSFPGPDDVLDYLGRYTHRVALYNQRITRLAHGSVSFTYRDRADRGKKKSLTLQASEFIRRFLLHVLPERYIRIRHFGFLANASKGRCLPQCRQLLGLAPEPPPRTKMTARQLVLQLTGIDTALCPRCQRGTLRPVARLEPVPFLAGILLSHPPSLQDTS